MTNYIGCTLAPALSDEAIAAYKLAIGLLPPGPTTIALSHLIDLVDRWWSLPESKPNLVVQFDGTSDSAPATIHANGWLPITKLDPSILMALTELIPINSQIKTYSTLFDVLQGPIRNVAFHLLWHAVELKLGREPLTTDKLRNPGGVPCQ